MCVDKPGLIISLVPQLRRDRRRRRAGADRGPGQGLLRGRPDRGEDTAFASCFHTAFAVAKTLPLPCVSTAFAVAKTPPLPRASTAFAVARHRLCLVFPHCLSIHRPCPRGHQVEASAPGFGPVTIRIPTSVDPATDGVMAVARATGGEFAGGFSYLDDFVG